MAEKLPTIRHARIPQFGVIEGGPLDGWHFGLTAVVVRGRSVFLDVNATPPAWPFPTAVRLNARTDFERLRNPGEVAPYHDTQKLIARAIEAEKHQWNE